MITIKETIHKILKRSKNSRRNLTRSDLKSNDRRQLGTALLLLLGSFVFGVISKSAFGAIESFWLVVGLAQTSDILVSYPECELKPNRSSIAIQFGSIQSPLNRLAISTQTNEDPTKVYKKKTIKFLQISMKIEIAENFK